MYLTTLAVLFWISFYVWYWRSYNSLIAFRNAVSQSWSHIEVELQRRFDLITNLVEVVKGYAAHESETLEKTIKARVRSVDLSVDEACQRSFGDAKVLGEIMAVVEQYPDLKADKQFLELQQALVETEDRIAERRSAYNSCVNRYKIYKETFPQLIVAWAGAFGEVLFFDAEEEATKAVKVVLS